MGQGKEVETLKAAAEKVKQDNTITRVLIAAGTYAESVTFENVPQDLTIEGESNDPKTGARIIAPEPQDKTQKDYAALRIVGGKTVVVRRLVLSGQGHGLVVQDTLSITVDNDYLTANLRTGGMLVRCGKVFVQKTRVENNGATLSNTGKPAATALFFGLVVEKSKDVTLQDSVFAHNGSGGVLVSSEPVAITVDNDYRVASITVDNDYRGVGDKNIAITVDNDYRVAMKSNSFHHNGPVGRASTASLGTSCQSDTDCSGGFCENSLCFRNLLLKQGNSLSLVGVGAAVAGVGNVAVEGNSFFANDTSALMVHSVNKLTFHNNAVERNGVRASSSSFYIERNNYPAVHLWNFAGTTPSLSMQYNLVIDNAANGIQVSHAPIGAQTLPQLVITASVNHIGGNGRFVSGNIPQGDGLCIVTPTQGKGFTLDAQHNYFTNNGRVGFLSAGLLQGQLSSNVFQQQRLRAVVGLQLHTSQGQSFTLQGNTIDGAKSYGVQFYKGNATLRIESNTIRGVEPFSSATNAAADGINLFDLQGTSVVIEGNFILGSKRVGVLIDNAKATLNNNTFQGNKEPLVTQNNASVTGNNANTATTPANPLPNDTINP